MVENKPFMYGSVTNPNARGIAPGARAHFGGTLHIGLRYVSVFSSSFRTARHKVGVVRIRDHCDRANAIARADISDEHKRLFSNPGRKVLCNPLMTLDPIFSVWRSIGQTASGLRELVFLVALMITFASYVAIKALLDER